jgi:Protein of unknown function (DUF1569)
MNNLFNPVDRESISRRLATLEPTSVRQWGKMNPAQMLQHCSRGLEAALGDRITEQLFFGKLLAPLFKGRVLGPRGFSRNSPTHPTFVISDARDFDQEITRLATIIDRFVQRGPESAGRFPHGFLGRISGEEWGRLMYKHLDHHLKQFGV